MTRRGNGRVRTDYGSLGCRGASAFIDHILVHSAMSRLATPGIQGMRETRVRDSTSRVCNERWCITAADARN